MERSAAVGLVLSYLAAFGLGCTRDATPPVAAAPEPAAPATPKTNAAADADVADAAAVVVDAPTATPDAALAVADAGKKPKRKFPDKCFKDTDCGPDAYCVLNFNGANFEKTPGHCSTEPPFYEGRPLVVDGELHRAAHARPADVAFDEHASVAAFARTIAALLALGAPRELIEQTSRALHDEIRHAEVTGAWAGEGPGALPAAVAPFPSFDRLAEELVIDVFRGGCLGETRAVERALARATLGGPRADLDRRIAEDEARHSALAFVTARWLANTFPNARRALDRELATCDAPELAPLLALLAPSHVAYA